MVGDKVGCDVVGDDVVGGAVGNGVGIVLDGEIVVTLVGEGMGEAVGAGVAGACVGDSVKSRRRSYSSSSTVSTVMLPE